jgi:hypothetical protein
LKLRLEKCFFGLHEMEFSWATLCHMVECRFRERKSKPLQSGQCLRRERRFVVSCNFVTLTPSSSVI